jgi:hypothetical protein
VLDACVWTGTGGSGLEVPRGGKEGLGGAAPGGRKRRGGGVRRSIQRRQPVGSVPGTPATGGRAWLLKTEEVGR